MPTPSPRASPASTPSGQPSLLEERCSSASRSLPDSAQASPSRPLASRTFAPWLSKLTSTDYRFHLVFLWLPSADFAVDRVADRVRLGGHSVPEATIRRRYTAGLRNFFGLYQPLATTWRMHDNSDPSGMKLIAFGKGSRINKVGNRTVWESILAEYGHG